MLSYGTQGSRGVDPSRFLFTRFLSSSLRGQLIHPSRTPGLLSSGYALPLPFPLPSLTGVCLFRVRRAEAVPCQNNLRSTEGHEFAPPNNDSQTSSLARPMCLVDVRKD